MSYFPDDKDDELEIESKYDLDVDDFVAEASLEKKKSSSLAPNLVPNKNNLGIVSEELKDKINNFKLEEEVEKHQIPIADQQGNSFIHDLELKPKRKIKLKKRVFKSWPKNKNNRQERKKEQEFLRLNLDKENTAQQLNQVKKEKEIIKKDYQQTLTEKEILEEKFKSTLENKRAKEKELERQRKNNQQLAREKRREIINQKREARLDKERLEDELMQRELLKEKIGEILETKQTEKKELEKQIQQEEIETKNLLERKEIQNSVQEQNQKKLKSKKDRLIFLESEIKQKSLEKENLEKEIKNLDLNKTTRLNLEEKQDKNTLKWYLEVARWPVFFIVLLDVLILLRNYYAFSDSGWSNLAERLSFLDNWQWPLEIFIFVITTYSIIKKRNQLPRIAGVAGALIGFMAGVIMAVIKFFWFRQMWNIFNLSAEGIFLALTGLAVSLVVSALFYEEDKD